MAVIKNKIGKLEIILSAVLAMVLPMAAGFVYNLLAKKITTVAVVVAGLPDIYESEGFDRKSMAMPEGHNRMIEAVAAVNPNTVVVLLCGSAVEVPWEDKVNAILYMGLPGEAGGDADGVDAG